MSKPLIAQMLAQRESRFEVMPGKFLKLRRPAEVESAGMRITVENLEPIVVGWEKFTEADLLGSSVGASTEVAFAFDVFSAWVVDRSAEFIAVWKEVQRLVAEHKKTKEAAEKN